MMDILSVLVCLHLSPYCSHRYHTLFIGWLPTSTGGGVRSSSMNYLTEDILNARPNVDLLLNTRVTSLTFTNSRVPTVSGVTVQKSKTGE